MELLGKFNKGIRFLLGAIDILVVSWVISLKDKIGFTITNALQKI